MLIRAVSAYTVVEVNPVQRAGGDHFATGAHLMRDCAMRKADAKEETCVTNCWVR